MAQLTYDPRVPARQYLALNVNNPPFFPQGINCSAPVNAALPYLCACTAIEAQKSAQLNVIRMAVYNLLSENGYNNQNFMQLLQIIAMRIDAELIRNQQQLPAQLAETVIPTAMAYYTGMVAAQHPDLRNYLQGQQNVYDNAVNAGHQMGPFVKEAEQIIASYMNRGMQQPMQQQGWQPAPVQQHQGWQPQAVQNGGWQPQPAQTHGWGNTNVGRRGDLQASDRFIKAETAHEVQNNVGFGGFAIAPASNQPVQPVQQMVWNNETIPVNQQQQVVEEPVYEAPAEPLIKNMLATEEQPYIYGFSPRTHIQELAFDDKGRVQQFVNERTNPVDYDKHGAPYPSFMARDPWKENFSAVAEETEKLMVAINDGIADALETTDEERKLFSDGNVLVASTVVADTGLQAAIASARFYRAEAKLANPGLMAHSITANLKTYLHEVDLSPEAVKDAESIMSGLSFHSNFVQVRDALAKLPDEFKRLHLRKLNLILTKEVNSIFRFNLNIGLKIHNFMEDIEQVDDILLEDYGRLVLSGWLTNQANHIANMFAVPFENGDVELFEPVEGLNNFCLNRYVTITQVSLPSLALDIEIPDNRAVLIVAQLNPTLHELVSSFIPQSTEYIHAHRHYIVTLDGLIFEVMPGWLASNTILIRFAGDEL